MDAEALREPEPYDLRRRMAAELAAGDLALSRALHHYTEAVALRNQIGLLAGAGPLMPVVFGPARDAGPDVTLRRRPQFGQGLPSVGDKQYQGRDGRKDAGAVEARRRAIAGLLLREGPQPFARLRRLTELPGGVVRWALDHPWFRHDVGTQTWELTDAGREAMKAPLDSPPPPP